MQDWTQQANDGSEGVVEVEYRSASEAGRQPDVQIITKQMAIVAWQPGPNRILQVPTEVSDRRTTLVPGSPHLGPRGQRLQGVLADGRSPRRTQQLASSRTLQLPAAP